MYLRLIENRPTPKAGKGAAWTALSTYLEEWLSPNLSRMEDKTGIENMKRLFPGITDEEATEAAIRFKRFTATLTRIWKQVEDDPEKREEYWRLTGQNLEDTLSGERSNITNSNSTNNTCNGVLPTSESQP
jgi:hypothetical protein